jgi:uncharacterized protein with HEPN domain
VQPTSADRIGHIALAIGDIRKVPAGQTRETFANNLATRMAVERLLEIISEASRHIAPEIKAKGPNINWRRLADLGNRLRHAYHRTDSDLLWSMVERDLEPLKNFVERMTKDANR